MVKPQDREQEWGLSSRVSFSSTCVLPHAKLPSQTVGFMLHNVLYPNSTEVVHAPLGSWSPTGRDPTSSLAKEQRWNKLKVRPPISKQPTHVSPYTLCARWLLHMWFPTRTDIPSSCIAACNMAREVEWHYSSMRINRLAGSQPSFRMMFCSLVMLGSHRVSWSTTTSG